MTICSRLHRALRRDHGVALPMVLIVFVVSVALVLAFMVVIVGSSTVTGANKAMVQAQAAAEAGVAAAQVEWADEPCSNAGTTLEGADPVYRVGITCDLTAMQATILSEGEATDGSLQTIEAVFALDPGTPAQTESFTDSVLSAGGSLTLSNMNFSTAGQTPNIRVFNGNLDCNVNVPGNIYVNGNVYLNTQCNVGGSIYATGHVGINGATVSGNVVALGAGDPTSGLTISGTIEGDYSVAGNLNIAYNGRVYGDVTAAGTGTHYISGRQIGKVGDPAKVWVGGNIELNQWAVNVIGDVHASGKITLSGGITVSGKAVTDQTITVPSNSSVGQQVKTKVDPPAAPNAPAFPTPMAYTLTKANWEAVGFTYETHTSAQCNSWNAWGATGWAGLSSKTVPTVIDASACSQLTTNFGQAQNPEIGVDIVLIAKKYDLTGFSVKSRAGTTPRMWFIATDAAQNSTINGAQVSAGVNALMFSEGSISLNSGTTWRGLMYSSSSTVSHGSTSNFLFLPVDIAGIDFMSTSGGGSGGGGTSGQGENLAALVSQRNRS